MKRIKYSIGVLSILLSTIVLNKVVVAYSTYDLDSPKSYIEMVMPNNNPGTVMFKVKSKLAQGDFDYTFPVAHGHRIEISTNYYAGDSAWPADVNYLGLSFGNSDEFADLMPIFGNITKAIDAVSYSYDTIIKIYNKDGPICF